MARRIALHVVAVSLFCTPVIPAQAEIPSVGAGEVETGTRVDGSSNNSDGSTSASPDASADPTLVRQEAYLKASSPGFEDRFGISVAIFANTAVIGAPREDGSGSGDELEDSAFPEAGAAHVFAREGTGAWSHQAYLKASDASLYDWFGISVAISGDTAVIGASEKDNGSGAAYVFVHDGAGSWSQQASLEASNRGLGNKLGSSAAISGNTAVVGAPYENSGATGPNGQQNNSVFADAGAAYVFVRDSSGHWSQQAYLNASDPEFDGRFGTSVAIFGDTLVVGAPGQQGSYIPSTRVGAGAAYVFVRDGEGRWSQQAYLKGSNTSDGDEFGGSVAISGNTVVVGASREQSSATGVDGDQNDDSLSVSGAAYVFVRDGAGAWSQQAYLKASNSDSLDLFGYSVAVSGDRAIVGAVGEDSSATGLDGDQTDNSSSLAGAAYVFARDGSGSWSQEAYVKASNAEPGDFFGGALAAFGDTAVIGAGREDGGTAGVNGDQTDNSISRAGAAYAFSLGSQAGDALRLKGRFRVTAEYETTKGEVGIAKAYPLNDASGSMYFFGEENLEFIIKVIDGRPLNGRYWVFAGGLTDLGVTLTVEDLATGAERVYGNPLGVPFQPIQDTSAFGTGNLAAVESSAGRWFTAERAESEGAEELLLNGGRFRVTAEYETTQGEVGVAKAFPLNDGSGSMYFFGEENLELMVKVLDGTPVNGRYWVFAGGLTDVGVTLTVEDLETGAERVYENPVGVPFQPIQDTGAF